MAKTLWYRIFGIGKIPEALKSELQSEGIVICDEGLNSSVTYRDFQAPGRRYGWRRQWFTGALALTQTRLVGLRASDLIIDVPLADDRIKAMQFTVENGSTLSVAFEAGLFQSDSSGRVECSFDTPEAANLLAMLREPIV